MGKKKAMLSDLVPAKGSKRSRGTNTSWGQFAAMVEWLEVKTNFNLIVGAATSTMKTGTVAGAKLTKTAGYDDLAEFVNQKCSTKWDRQNAESRVRAYIKRFKMTKRALLCPEGAKYCVGDEDRAKGIETIEQKLEADCPHYARMDVLFGGRQNVTPACVLVPGKPRPAQCVAADDNESEDNDDESVEDSDDDCSVLGTPPEFHVESQEVAEVLVAMSSPSHVSSISSHSADVEPKRKKAKKATEVNAELFPTHLKERCAETVASASNAAELTVKVAEMKNVAAGKTRKDFHCTYSEVEAKKILLEEKKLAIAQAETERKERIAEAESERKERWEREKWEFEKENRLRSNDSLPRSEMQRLIVQEMLRQGKGCQEIKDTLTMLL